MPPRKSAAAASAAGEGQSSMLKLIMEKGPASGTTREFRPGVTVHIGRVVRGNTIAVKDAGISSKHLLIQADAASDSEGRHWAVTDLDSSNGTILNGAKLGPQEPAILSDGDVIKIGEKTSIRVEIVSVGVNEVSGGVRRTTRRRVKEQVPDLMVIDEDDELGLQSYEDEGNIEVEVKQRRNVNTRSSAKVGNSAKDLNAEADKDPGPCEIKGSRGVSTRRTRSSQKKANAEEIEIDLSVIEGKRTTRGGRGRKKQPVETISEEPVNEVPIPELEEEEERAEVGVDKPAVEAKNSLTEGAANGATTSSAAVQEPNIKSVIVDIGVDLEKMTLGEWLKYVEEYEVQQIMAETEKMLDEMRQKAKRCHEYMLEQKRAQQS